MTQEEYTQLKETLKDYEMISSHIENLKSEKENVISGIDYIRSENNDFLYVYDMNHGNGFKNLILKKIIEAYDEQIEKLEKQLEELTL